MITKQQIVEALENDQTLTVGVWSFFGKNMSCWHNGCCDDTYESFEEAADAVIFYARKKDLSDIDIN